MGNRQSKNAVGRGRELQYRSPITPSTALLRLPIADCRIMRLFVGLALPEIVADALTQLQSGLPGARWTPDENFHLTLQFVGEADRHGAGEIHLALSGIDAPGFEMKLSGCGAFGGEKPRALWVGVAPEPALTRLQSKVSTALSRAGFPAERRKFTPHVTIAYLNGASRDSIERFCASHGLFSCGPFPVGDFHLYRSHTGGEASHYEILETYSLSRSR
jgi:2'-5' RNA ligase